MCAKVLKDAKDWLERENDAYVRALDKRIDAESKYRKALDCVSNSTRSENDLLNVAEMLNSDKDDTKVIANSKKSRKIIAGMLFCLSIGYAYILSIRFMFIRFEYGGGPANEAVKKTIAAIGRDVN